MDKFHFPRIKSEAFDNNSSRAAYTDVHCRIHSISEFRRIPVVASILIFVHNTYLFVFRWYFRMTKISIEVIDIYLARFLW